jgi:hypothetical protein
MAGNEPGAVVARRDQGVVSAKAKLKEYWGDAHILTDIEHLEASPSNYMPVVSVVEFKQAKAGDGDCYAIPGGAGKLAFTKTALDRFSTAAGVSWDWSASGRVDDGKDPYYCEFRAVGNYITLDGQRRSVAMTKRIDLREGGADFEEITRIAARNSKDPMAQISGARQHILSMAESKAKNRVVREVCGLKSSYDKEAIKKPFVLTKLVWIPPEGNPAIDAMIAAKELGMEHLLYSAGGEQQPQRLQAAQPAPPLLPAPKDDDPEPPATVELTDDGDPADDGLEAPPDDFPF